MAKTLSKSALAASIADATQITKKQASQVLDHLASLAYKQAKNAFVLPGIGKIVVAARPAREMVMRFGPKAGQKIKIPAKRVLKFRFAKLAKDQILGGKK